MRPARLGLALLAAAALSAGAAERACAVTDSVLVRVGGDLAGRTGDYIDVPVTVDLSGAPGRQLGSYGGQLTWNPAVLAFVQIDNGTFAAPQVNSTAADSGRLVLAAVQPTGAGGVVTLFVARFYVLSDTAESNVAIAINEMSASAASVTAFENLLPLVRYVQGTFCRSLGRWGDVNGDGQVNSLDALVALSVVVGIPVDTTIMTPALADVDGDGAITSRDALIMLSYAVGLPVTGFRVLLPAAGACATGAATTLAVSPDSIELEAGQGVAVSVQASDASGRAVPADSVTWTSSNPAVAGYDAVGGQVLGRSAGVATLTAQLGPGVQGTLKVSVLARRTTWYVDVQRALNAPVQVGSQAWPFQYIGDAVGIAQSGDTVLVAGGTYEEEVDANVSVVLLGDSTNRPVLDPRGGSYWSTYDDALSLSSPGTPLVVANFDVRAGAVYLVGHDVTVRNVAVEGLSGTSTSAGLEISSGNYTPAPSPQAGARLAFLSGQSLGNVLVSGVVVSGDSLATGILVDQADTATLVGNTVSRASAGTSVTCGGGPSASSGILVVEASVSVLRGNTVVNPVCQGIGAYDQTQSQAASDIGRTIISANRVSGATGIGIGAAARLVALDHNAVRNTGLIAGQQSYGQSVGIHTGQLYNGEQGVLAPDSVTSVADTILSSGGRGFAVDTAGSVVVDSMVVANTGLDSSGYYEGYGYGYGDAVDLNLGGAFVVRHSHLSTPLFDNAIFSCNGGTSLRTLGNRIVNSGYAGISTVPCSESGIGVDSLFSTADTILDSYASGILATYTPYTFVDAAVVDSAGNFNAIDVDDGGYLRVQNSSARRSYYAGVRGYYMNHVEIVGDTLVGNLSNGIYLESVGDSVLVQGNRIDSTLYTGIWLNGSVNAIVDSNRVVNNGTNGILFGASGGVVTRSRFQNNGWEGVQVADVGECCGYDSVVVRQSVIEASDTAGAGVYSSYGSVLDAAFNYWGDSAGPTCKAEFNVGGCSPNATVGDSIATTGVIFTPYLAAEPSPAPPAPPARTPVLAAMRAASGIQARAAGLRGRASNGSAGSAKPSHPRPHAVFGLGRGILPATVARGPAQPRAGAQSRHAPVKVSGIRLKLRRP